MKKEDFSYIVQLVCFELTSDISGAFGAFGAFFVKTIRFQLYCTEFTRAFLVHLVHLLTSDTSGAFGAFSEFVVKTLDFSYIVQLVRFELTSDMSGAFGAFVAF